MGFNLVSENTSRTRGRRSTSSSHLRKRTTSRPVSRTRNSSSKRRASITPTQQPHGESDGNITIPRIKPTRANHQTGTIANLQRTHANERLNHRTIHYPTSPHTPDLVGKRLSERRSSVSFDLENTSVRIYKPSPRKHHVDRESSVALKVIVSSFVVGMSMNLFEHIRSFVVIAYYAYLLSSQVCIR